MNTVQWYNPATWELPFFWVWLGFLVIVLARAGGTYLVGRAMRVSADHTERTAKILHSKTYLRAERSLVQWGAPLVAVSFLTIGFQTAVNFAAGIMRMPWYRYLPALAIGGAAWAAIYGALGLVSFTAIGMAYERWPQTTTFGIILAAVLLLSWIVWKLVERKKRL